MAERVFKIDTIRCHGADTSRLLRPPTPITLHYTINQETATREDLSVACSYAKKIRNVSGEEKVVCLAGLAVQAEARADKAYEFQQVVHDIDLLALEENADHWYRETGFKTISRATLPCIQKYPY